MASILKKNNKVELELLKDIDMLFMVEKGIRGGINGLKHFKDQKLLLIIEMMWMIYIKTLKNTIPIKSAKFW